MSFALNSQDDKNDDNDKNIIDPCPFWLYNDDENIIEGSASIRGSRGKAQQKLKLHGKMKQQFKCSKIWY
jgi:hypothetical protein